MTSTTSLLVFGLPRSMCPPDVRALLGLERSVQVDMLDLPGSNSQAWAHVRLPHKSWQIRHLATQVNNRHVDGRRLESWVPAMAWA